MQFSYRPSGVCAAQISFDLEDNIVRNVSFLGGCNGNLKAIGKLCEGMDADRLTEILLGNTCGRKGTSCADQLARAVLAAKAEAAAN